MKPMKPMQGMQPMEPMRPMEPMKAPDRWWPEHFGSPNSSGGQNDVRYAYFAKERRLLVDVNDRVFAYDTGDHQINGIQQAQGDRSRLVFSSSDGPVPLSSLKTVELD